MTIQNTEWAGLDPSKREAFSRATGPLNEPTVLVDNVVNRVVQQLSAYYQGAVSTMDRRPGQGASSIQVDRTPLSGEGSAAGNAARWVGTDSPTDTVGAYARTSWSYKTLATRGSVTRLQQAQGRSYIDVMAEEMSAKIEDMNEVLESALFQSTGSGDSITGLMEYIGNGSARNGQCIDANIGTPAAVMTLTLEALDKAIDVVKGNSMRSDLVIYCSQAGSRQLNKLLQSEQQFNDVTEIAAGFRVRTYDGIPIVITSGIPDDSEYDHLAAGTRFKKITGEVTNPSTSIWIVNKRYVWLEELTPLTVLPLAKSTSASDSFDIYWDGVMVVGNWMGVGCVIGVDPSA